MKLKILGSSSAGNGYLFDNGKEALLVECGMPYRMICEAVGFDLGRIAGAIVSHEHGDHARHIGKVLQMRIPCYMSTGTAKALSLEEHALVIHIEEGKTYRIGGFTIRGFAVEHDASEPLGYLIHHREMGTTLFATDTYYLRYRFGGLSNILLECNYREDILERNLEAGIISKPQRDRTIKSHMSYETCREVLEANDLKRVNNIVLIHLSEANSHAEDFRRGIGEQTGKSVHIAEDGLTLDFDRAPF